MPSPIKFRTEFDNSAAFRWGTQTKNIVKDVQDNIKSYLGGKLTQLFAVSAIEETVRRTGEWADNLRKSAQELSINTDQMQALQLIASRARVDIGNVTGYYKRMSDAAKEALNGNVMLKNSLRNLGIEGNALKTGTGAQLFDIMSQKVGGKPGAFSNDLQRIFGEESLTNIGAVLKTTGGATVGEYAKKNTAQIVDQDTITSISDAWTEFFESLTRLGNRLKFLVVWAIDLVNGITKAISGAVAMAKMSIKMIGLGIASPFSKGAYDEYVSTQKRMHNIAVKSFGKEPTGIMSAEDVATASDISALWGEIGTAAVGAATGGAGSLVTEALAKQAAKKAASKAMMEGILSRLSLGKAMTESEIAGSGVTEEAMAAGMKKFKIINDTAKVLSGGGMAAAGVTIGAMIAGKADVEQNKNNLDDIEKQMRLNRLIDINPATLTGGTMGGGGNLKIGGVFGTDLSMQIINLNSQMVDLLQQIVYNTGRSPGDYSTSQLGNN